MCFSLEGQVHKLLGNNYFFYYCSWNVNPQTYFDKSCNRDVLFSIEANCIWTVHLWTDIDRNCKLNVDQGINWDRRCSSKTLIEAAVQMSSFVKIDGGRKCISKVHFFGRSDTEIAGQTFIFGHTEKEIAIQKFICGKSA